MKYFLQLFIFSFITFSVACAEEAAELSVKRDLKSIRSASETSVVSYADTLEKATPSVVSVFTARYRQMSSQQSRDLYLEFLRQFGVPTPNIPNRESEPGQREKLEQVGVGSGVIISEDGYIVTNHHVIQVQSGQLADEIRVRLNNDQEFIAELIGSDAKTDVAVLKIDADEPLPAVVLADSDNLRVGDVVFAIGNPLNVGLTATQGIVSATGRTSFGILGPGAYENFIQTDAAINMGNSGGALIDAWGRLVGINTAIVSRTGGNIGIGFSIPINMALNVAENLIENGEVPRGLLGLLPGNLTSEQAEAFGLKTTRGALVNEVQSGSPADNAGVVHGDVITQVNDVLIDSAEELRVVISQILPGTEVILTIVRRGEVIELPVVLGSLNGTMAGKLNSSQNKLSILPGITLETLSEENRKAYSIPKDIEGLVVTDASFDSELSDVLSKGMVILEVNRVKVDTIEEVDSELRNGVNQLYVWVGGAKRFVIIKIER